MVFECVLVETDSNDFADTFFRLAFILGSDTKGRLMRRWPVGPPFLLLFNRSERRNCFYMEATVKALAEKK